MKNDQSILAMEPLNLPKFNLVLVKELYRNNENGNLVRCDLLRELLRVSPYGAQPVASRASYAA